MIIYKHTHRVYHSKHEYMERHHPDTVGWNLNDHASSSLFPNQMMKHQWKRSPLQGDISSEEARPGEGSQGPPSFLRANHPPPKGSLSSSISHTDSWDADRCNSHPVFHFYFQFQYLYRHDNVYKCCQNQYIMTRCLRTKGARYLFPITSYFYDRDDADCF